VASFFIKQDDTAPALQYTIKDEDEVAIDVSGSTVKFYMQDEHGVTKIDAGTVTLVDAANGVVSYAWAAPDTDTAGIYYAEFVVTFSDGTIRTSPDPGWISVIISGSVRGD